MATTLSRSRGGPSAVPRRVSRWVLIGLELLIGANAVYGGVALMVNGMGMPTEWLVGTPFGSWLLPGGFLILIIAVPMAAAATAELVRSPRAYQIALAAGLIQIGWNRGAGSRPPAVLRPAAGATPGWHRGCHAGVVVAPRPDAPALHVAVTSSRLTVSSSFLGPHSLASAGVAGRTGPSARGPAGPGPPGRTEQMMMESRRPA
jgi:hypothetical protein